METLALTFGSPQWLWGFLLLPIFAAIFVWSHLRARALVGKVVAPRLRPQLAGSVSVFRRVLRGVFILSALACALLALAQPRYGFTEQPIKQKGRDIIVAVDTSRSMLATDVAPTRLARAKLLTQDLIRLLQGDRIGLVAFAGSAFLQAPLTLDYGAVINSLDELDTNIIPKGGTNIAAAIETAEQAFGKAEGQTRALVILTDGEELDADGVAAAKKAADLGIRIFTVGIGSAEGSLIPFKTDDGKQDFVRDVAGKPVQSRLDTKRLEEIATATGGFYVGIGPDAAKEIFQRGIEPMDVSEMGLFASRQPLERYQWPLGVAICALVLWLLLGERKRRTARLAALALLLTPLLQAAPSALVDYQSGNYAEAKKAFEDGLKNQPNSRELQFNAGSAAYKSGDFEQAVSYFTGALLAEDTALREKAAYNLGNSLVRRGEAATSSDAKKADWKNAIEQYSEALNLNPKNKQAEENRAIVKKLLEDLEKQDKQKQDQQNKDQQNKDQQNKDQQNKDQQNKDQQNKDQQNKDQQNKDQQNKDQQSKDQQSKDEQNKDQQNPEKKDDQGGDEKQQPQDSGSDRKQDQTDKQGEKPQPAPTPGEKKEGEVKAANPDQKKDDKSQAPAAAAPGDEQEKDGEMSAAQARALLKSLNSEEEKVNLMRQPDTQEVLRDW